MVQIVEELRDVRRLLQNLIDGSVTVNISVVGLGKLGLCTAACFASKGHKVIGVERNVRFVEELQARRSPIEETDLDALLERSWDNLTVTDDIAYAVRESDVILIIVPTPSEGDGRFTNKYVEAVLESIGPVLGEKDRFTVVDVVSTVMPGSSDAVFKPLLEKLSGKNCGDEFGLVYNPEFIALGSVVRDFLNPDMVLIGASDEKSSEMIRKLYLSTCDSDPEISEMSLVNAEIAKLSLNCFVTMKISFANELASLCENISGANVDTVTTAIGSDSRVGGKYLKGGLGFGGPCFPRDNLAFQACAKEFGYQAKLSPQVVAINEAVVGRLSAKVSERVTPGGKVAILGMSYKPGTHIVEESQSVILAEQLCENGYKVSVHDAKALGSVKEVLGESVSYEADKYDCVKDADAVVLMTNWPEYSDADWGKVKEMVHKDAVVVDSWRTLDSSDILDGIEYVALGKG